VFVSFFLFAFLWISRLSPLSLQYLCSWWCRATEVGEMLLKFVLLYCIVWSRSWCCAVYCAIPWYAVLYCAILYYAVLWLFFMMPRDWSGGSAAQIYVVLYCDLWAMCDIVWAVMCSAVMCYMMCHGVRCDVMLCCAASYDVLPVMCCMLHTTFYVLCHGHDVRCYASPVCWCAMPCCVVP
jgi:hypothetical protein